MAYEVTATRKRPQAFEKLVGQEFVVSTIENAISSGRIAHAYLFSGPRGVGKTSSARLLAKALNCEHGPTAHPCGECVSCKEITQGYSVDVIEIDGASNTSVNDIRVIKDEVLFPPQSSRYKIYIIDEVHMLSTSAFNALLKTIEEPPEYIIFIFATTELQKVPATIRSRCQQFHFQLIPLETIKGCLREAAQEMNIKADDDALFWIAREGNGSMRDAYTLFDQVAAFSQDHITLEKIKNKLGFVGSDQIANIVLAALKNNVSTAITELNKIFSKGISVEQCVRDLTQFFRAILFIKQGITNEEMLNMRTEEIPDEVLALLSANQAEAALRSLLQLYREIRYSISPKFEAELFISRLSGLPFLVSSQELVKKLDELKKNVTEGKVTVVKEKELSIVSSNVVPAKVEKPIEQPTIAVEEKQIEQATPAIEEKPKEPQESNNKRVPTLEDIKAISNMDDIESVFGLQNALDNVNTVALSEDGCLELRTDSPLPAKTIRNNSKLINELLFKLTGFEGGINSFYCEKPKEKINPTLEKIATCFRGTIIKND
ncbi:DNA polymerase III subunit gamma/tau [Bullifex porci]|uniref:DNA polymerase III subunit gamma/tau n=1 Tax=Bullifex porci TaxID=2606638 RepID=UPI0023F53BFE|nr:DNA polymerase III subunit gamma/tau [Bullifex porci]MDD7254556.1 DNA polymerase III subunit gamma/tau [Bullifex porci]MDY2741775.1 DNA polymerase III subunit gamma/tau [Bullifex porci]